MKVESDLLSFALPTAYSIGEVYLSAPSARCETRMSSSSSELVVTPSESRVSRWLPAEKLSSDSVFTGIVLDSRHRGRFVFFVSMCDIGSSVVHQLLFRSLSSSGAMDDDELRTIKQSVRPGDRLQVTVHSIEQPAAPDGTALLHVRTAKLLSMSLRSNTGFEHTGADHPNAGNAKASGDMSGAAGVSRSSAGGDERITAASVAAPPSPPPWQPSRSEAARQARQRLANQRQVQQRQANLTAKAAAATAPSQPEEEGGEAAAGEEEEEEEAEEHGASGSGGEARRQERAQLFASWVTAHFPQLQADGDAYESRGRVLDVAGGRGELSLHLTLAGVACTLVDPRPSSGFLSKWQRKMLRKSGRPSFQVVHMFFGDAGGEASAALARDSSLILGMHPDECTEAIVDAALAARRPFAIVPCCVFTRLFPQRRLASGQAVRTREQFCNYLQAKEPSSIRIGSLPFKGANAIVYALSLPGADDDAAAAAPPDVFTPCEPCAPEEAPDPASAAAAASSSLTDGAIEFGALFDD